VRKNLNEFSKVIIWQARFQSKFSKADPWIQFKREEKRTAFRTLIELQFLDGHTQYLAQILPPRQVPNGFHLYTRLNVLNLRKWCKELFEVQVWMVNITYPSPEMKLRVLGKDLSLKVYIRSLLQWSSSIFFRKFS
jgi:hypothetical protein